MLGTRPGDAEKLFSQYDFHEIDFSLKEMTVFFK
jgi:hypothetical protein